MSTVLFPTRVPRSAGLPARRQTLLLWLSVVYLTGLIATDLGLAGEFQGRIVDAKTGQPLAARVYLRDSRGEWLFVQSTDKGGSALAYEEQWVPMPGSQERHTTVSAHPFRRELAPGEYEIEVERGKEYLPVSQKFVVKDKPVERTIRLKRWIDLASRGWYSGETHVHRRIVELPNVMLAEDLNVSFPVTFWTIRSDAAPDLLPSPLRRQGPSPFGPREDRGTAPISVDEDHVILPRNTEYEVFSVDGKSHLLGAMFLLNHKSVFETLAPPVGEIARRAHAEGALLDLDKHSWPWSMMLVPVAGIDLFELSNNSVWRTNFGFKQSPVPLPEWMPLEREGPDALTEWGWLNSGWEVYYALLNCGFQLAPTAGTASGVHPVPLGHSRVYVHTGQKFSVDRWLAGLKAGRSFVTTGPMLFATVDGQLAGERFAFEGKAPRRLAVDIETVSEQPVSTIEILVNGQVVDRFVPELVSTPERAWQAKTRREIDVAETGWLVVRSVEPRSGGRRRFAHTAPWHFTIAGGAIVPRREQVRYFVNLMEQEIARNRGVLKPEALREFEQARDVYRELLQRAR
ncbi:MAG: CehA/McbA family metallohydrolase [Planctomycetota bacterium]|nr:CehA/McbA family metallohydrolase [Planctomycetota bacterium]